MYYGSVLEDLKQMSYLLGALGRSGNPDAARYAEAANHALQILDRNRDKITDYEKKTRSGLHGFNSL